MVLVDTEVYLLYFLASNTHVAVFGVLPGQEISYFKLESFEAV